MTYLPIYLAFWIFHVTLNVVTDKFIKTKHKKEQFVKKKKSPELGLYIHIKIEELSDTNAKLHQAII